MLSSIWLTQNARAGVRVSLDGRHVLAPPGVVDADGCANLVKGVKKCA